MLSERQNLYKEISQEGYSVGEKESELERASYYKKGSWFGWTIILTLMEKQVHL